MVFLGDSNSKYWITTERRTEGNFNAGIYLRPFKYISLNLGLNTNPMSYSMGIGIVINDFAK